MEIGLFFNSAFQILEGWSRERSEFAVNNKTFALTPNYSISLFTEAYQWTAKKPQLKTRKQSDDITWYFASPNGANLKEQDISKFLRMNKNISWRSFNSYVECQNSLRMISFNCANLHASNCTCNFFKKSYTCKHIVGIAILTKILQVPPEAKNIPIGTKRKRGRPAKAKKALVVQ